MRDADVIYVLDAGTIKECGSHRELIAVGGRYADLFAMQAVGYSALEDLPACTA